VAPRPPLHSLLYQAVNVDNQSAVTNCLNASYTSKLKHVLIRQRFCYQRIAQRKFKLLWIGTDDNLADICTKGSSIAFYQQNLPRLLSSSI
jgi:hypothetical protein